MSLRLVLILTALATLACASPLQDARTLAETDPVAALASVESLLAAAPADPLLLEALGDLHLNAMGSPQGDRTHATAAVEAFTKLVDVQPRPGIYKSKLAFAEQLAGLSDAGRRAGAAWRCCRDASAVALLEEAATIGQVLSQGTWELQGWSKIDGYSADPPGRLVIRADGSRITAVDGGVAPTLGAGFASRVVATGDPVTFMDHTHPRTAPGVGFVDGHKHCDQPYEGFDCRSRTVRAAEIHLGPCWHAEEPPEGDEELVDPETVDWKRVRCIPGKPKAQAEACPDETGSCQVTFDVVSYPHLRIAAADVWLLPAKGVAPGEALLWGQQVAGDVPARLAAGELALGLPEPLVRWAARDTPEALPTAFHLDKDELSLTYTSQAGSFTFVGGALVDWSK